MKSIFGFGAAGLGNLDLSVLGLGSTIAATALVTTLSQPAWAAATRITGVEVNDTDSGIELLLMQARSGDRPQVFSVERGNSWVADIINSELALPSGGSFQSMNPAPGIASVQVVPLDANSVRVIVTGESGAPAGELTTRSAQGLAFNFDASGGGSAAAPRSSTAPAAASTTVAQGSGANPDVLVPNPEITITGGQPTAIPRANPAPPFLPRAVAPPLGDIAVSDLSPQATSIDLGTVERVPRLVLRDAPAREVLALLARAAGLNIAFIDGSAGEGEGAAAGEGPIVRVLDIEGEPVQDVFNYVLRLTNLRAVRQGRTILVGTELPDAVQTRNTIVRTLRVNQADAAAVANFLVAQGAEARLVETVTTRTIENEGTINQSVREE
ncbi:MAG: AMIN domain-containing protein, partial [Prochlorothrix sp.]